MTKTAVKHGAKSFARQAATHAAKFVFKHAAKDGAKSSTKHSVKQGVKHSMKHAAKQGAKSAAKHSEKQGAKHAAKRWANLLLSIGMIQKKMLKTVSQIYVAHSLKRKESTRTMLRKNQYLKNVYL